MDYAHAHEAGSLNEKSRPYPINTRLLWSLLIWFLVCSIVYALIWFKDDARKNRLARIGVDISKNISSQAGLPLLEKDARKLRQLLKEAAQKPNVVYASIIDHKNKLIAYTDQKQFFTLNQNSRNVMDKVNYWEVADINNKHVMNFTSDVTFGGTRIGETFISIAANQVTAIKQGFVLLAALSLLIIFTIFIILPPKGSHENFWKTFHTPFSLKKREPQVQSMNYYEITCPLCARQNIFARDQFGNEKLSQFPVLTLDNPGQQPIFLQDISTRKELNWLKKRIVLQCLEIINKIIVTEHESSNKPD